MNTNCYFRYVPNPTKILAKLKAQQLRGEIETIEGKIVAGDPAELDVVDVKGQFTI